MVVGVDFGDGFGLPYGLRPHNYLRLPACCCKVLGPDDDPLPRFLRAKILPKGGGADTSPPPRLGFFEGNILDSCRHKGEFSPHFHHRSLQNPPVSIPSNGTLKKVDKDVRECLVG